MHEEPWAFAIIQDAKAWKSLADRAKPLFIEEAHRTHLDRGGHAFDRFTHPDFNIFSNAGTLLLICGRLIGPFVAADCWLASENLMLAACAAGLGIRVIGSALPALNAPEVKAEIGIPADDSAVAPIIVGVPSGETPLSLRKEPTILVWT